MLTLAGLMAAMGFLLAACGGANVLGFDDAWYSFEVTKYSVERYTGSGDTRRVGGRGTLTNTIIRLDSELSVSANINEFVEAGYVSVASKFDGAIADTTGEISGYMLHTFLVVTLYGENDQPLTYVQTVEGVEVTIIRQDIIETLTIFYRGRHGQNFIPHSSFRAARLYTQSGAGFETQQYKIVSRFASRSVTYTLTNYSGSAFPSRSGTIGGLSYPVFDNDQMIFGIRAIAGLNPGFSTQFVMPNVLDNTAHTVGISVGGATYVEKNFQFNGASASEGRVDASGAAVQNPNNWAVLPANFEIVGINAGTPIRLYFLRDNFSTRPDQILHDARVHPFVKPTKNILASVRHRVYRMTDGNRVGETVIKNLTHIFNDREAFLDYI